jgi:signal transduction histidine kinase
MREKDNQPKEMSIIYNNLGLVYYNLRDYKKAISYHAAALKINSNLEDEYTSTINMANIGLCHLGNNEYQTALDYFLKVEKHCIDDCSIEAQIQSLGGIGIIYYDKKEFEKSKKYFLKSNTLSSENDIVKYLPSNYNYLAHISFENHEMDSSLMLLNKAHEVALESEDIDWITNNLELYSRIYAYNDNFEKALLYHQQFVTFRDSMYNDEVIQNLSEIHVDMQKSKDESIIKGLDNEITVITQQTIMLGLVVLAVSILLLMQYQNNKVRKRINAKLGDANLTIENKIAELNEMNLNLDNKVKLRTESLHTTNEALIDSRTELDNFIYKISHDIQGPLATLKGVCDIGLIDVKDQTGREYLTRLSTTAEELNNVILRLQRVNQIISTTVDSKVIDFDSIINIAVLKAKELSTEYDTVITQVNVQCELNFETDIDLIAIIFNNLITNAFQFYDNRKNESIIGVTVKAESEHLIIEIRDNGIGIEVDDTKDLFRMFSRFSGRNRTGGIGLFLVKTAVDKLSGKISVHKNNPEEDTVFVVQLPYDIQNKSTSKVEELVAIYN